MLPKVTSAMRLRGLIVRPSNSAIRCLNLGNAASILVPKTSRLTSRPSCAPDHEVKSLLVYGIQLAPSNKTDTACQSSVSVSSHVSPSSLSSTQIAVALIFKIHPIMHKIFTRHCLSDAIKTLEVEVKTSGSSSAGELHPCDRVTGGSCPPPVPTERGVRFSRTTLFDRWFTALCCYSFQVRFHGQLHPLFA